MIRFTIKLIYTVKADLFNLYINIKEFIYKLLNKINKCLNFLN